jgi:hypothetical protein
MQKSLITIVISIISLLSVGQSTFFRYYNFGTVEYVYQVLSYNNRIFINTATSCGSQCSFLSEIDVDGNILWKTEVPDIDAGLSTMVIVNDTITVTGKQ